MQIGHLWAYATFVQLAPYLYLFSDIALCELFDVVHFLFHGISLYNQLVLLVWIEYMVDNLLL